jgi:hypothetical protein
VNEITLMRFVPPTGPGRFKERFILSALSIYLNQCGQDFLERKLSTCVHAVMSQKHPGTFYYPICPRGGSFLGRGMDHLRILNEGLLAIEHDWSYQPAWEPIDMVSGG